MIQENFNMEYQKEQIRKEVDSILLSDSNREKRKNLRCLDIWVIYNCDLGHLYTHDEAEELRRPILEAREKLGR